MLARVTGGKSGIVEYLENGIKSGRELDRDQLDKRITLDGSLKVTDEIIKSMDSAENYLHITLSFSEKDISNEKIAQVYSEYKSNLMAAYDIDEFNVYAEIHQPKIKSYQDKKTGEIVDRLPHVHVVIPKKNLVTDKAFNPFGKYSDIVKYHDAIQEHVNRKFDLSSPYDSQRPINFEGNAKFLSRYKGDTFSGAGSEIKSRVLDLILEKNIKTPSELVKQLENKGVVSFGKLGAQDEYIKFKEHGSARNVRLTESCFKEGFLKSRLVIKEKPSDKTVSKLVSEWVDTLSHEKKLIHSASPKVRKEYYSLNKDERRSYLDEQRKGYDNKYFSERGRQTNNQSSLNRNRLKFFADIPNGLPSLPQRGMVRGNNQRPTSPASILPANESHHLDTNGAKEHNQLRRPLPIGRSGRITSFEGFKNKVVFNVPQQEVAQENRSLSLSEQLLKQHVEDKKQSNELALFRVIRRDLKADNLLDYLADPYGLDKTDYSVIRAKDGSERIKHGTLAYNVSDFCTKHLNLSWDITKEILKDSYTKQKVVRSDKQIVNSIVFASNYTTIGRVSKSKSERLNESIMILKYLQRIEKQGAPDMLNKLNDYRNDLFTKENSISSDQSTSLTDNMVILKKNRDLASKLDLKMQDVVAKKDVKNGVVDFHDANSGKPIFKDFGERITLNDRKPDINHVAAAMSLAAEKFGVVKIKGTSEFKQQVIDVAIAKDLKVVFADKAMQARFIEAKEALRDSGKFTDVDSQQNEIVKASRTMNDNEPQAEAKATDKPQAEAKATDRPQAEAKATDKPQADLKTGTIIEHGAAKYQFDPESSKSYFVKLDNGETLWGAGLKDAIKASGASNGDKVTLAVNDKTPVTVPEKIKDEDGKVIGVTNVDTHRNEWKIDVLEKAPEEAQAAENKEAAKPKEDDEKHIVTYKWDSIDKKMTFEINGKHPQAANAEVLEKIQQKDPFLKNYNMDELQHGKLDLDKAGDVQAIPRTYDNQGQIVTQDTAKQQHAPRMT